MGYPSFVYSLHALNLAAAGSAWSNCSGALRGGLCRLSVVAEYGYGQTDYGCVAAVTTLSVYCLYCRVIVMWPSSAGIAVLQHTVCMWRSPGIHSAASGFGGNIDGAYYLQTCSQAFVSFFRVGSASAWIRFARGAHLSKTATGGAASSVVMPGTSAQYIWASPPAKSVTCELLTQVKTRLEYSPPAFPKSGSCETISS
jgi:hypothetical protein